MGFQVDVVIKNKTPCDKWYICLGGDPDLLCAVKEAGEHYICLQERSPVSHDVCYMRREKGGETRCFCPVRIEIFKKYGV